MCWLDGVAGCRFALRCASLIQRNLKYTPLGVHMYISYRLLHTPHIDSARRGTRRLNYISYFVSLCDSHLTLPITFIWILDRQSRERNQTKQRNLERSLLYQLYDIYKPPIPSGMLQIIPPPTAHEHIPLLTPINRTSLCNSVGRFRNCPIHPL